MASDLQSGLLAELSLSDPMDETEAGIWGA